MTRPTKLRRRQTIDTVQGRHYSSRRTALQHLQAMFWPMRDRIKTEHEQIPMVKEKQPTKLRRTSSVYDNQTPKPGSSSERRRRFRTQQRSDTVAIL